jgi:hypothetical protein
MIYDYDLCPSKSVAAELEEHGAYAPGWRYDTSPPNGML